MKSTYEYTPKYLRVDIRSIISAFENKEIVDSGKEYLIKKALSRYIFDFRGSIDLVQFVLSVDWL